MKTQEAIRKSCENCKFFSFRYYRTEYKFSLALGEGVCGVRKYTEEERAKLPFGFVCDKWRQRVCAETDISAIKDELAEITSRLIVIVKTLSK